MAKISEHRLHYWLDYVGFPEKQTKVREDAVKYLTALQKSKETTDQEKAEIAETIEAIKRGWPYC